MQTVRVEKEDIKNGMKMSNVCCPVALALNRTFQTTDVFVGCGVLRVGDKLRDVPRRVEKFIHRFDSGVRVRPFSFEIDIP